MVSLDNQWLIRSWMRWSAGVGGDHMEEVERQHPVAESASNNSFSLYLLSADSKNISASPRAILLSQKYKGFFNFIRGTNLKGSYM